MTTKGPRLPRWVLEHLTHRLPMRRRLPAPFDHVRIYVSSEGGLRYLRPSLVGVDPVLLALVQEWVHQGAVAWDVGANVGLFTFSSAWAAGPSGHVVAVEPDTWLVDRLRRSARRHPGAPVDIVPAAVADRVGVQKFAIAARNRSTNYLEGHGTTQTGGVREWQSVPTLTLDMLAETFPRPDVIKIDVEGAEARVLAGGRHMLTAARPVLVCEVAAENASEVRQLLYDLQYEIFDGAVPPPRRPIAVPGHVTLALPR